MVYGSFHFITFDGTEYSFKALGEFVILRLSSSTGSNIFTLQGQTDKLRLDGKGIIEVPVVVRLAAFHQGIGKVRICVCVERIHWKRVDRNSLIISPFTELQRVRRAEKRPRITSLILVRVQRHAR